MGSRASDVQRSNNGVISIKHNNILTLSVLSPLWSIVYVAAKGLIGYIHVQTMLTSPAIPGLIFLIIPKSSSLFWENYIIFTLLVPENFQFPRKTWKTQGVGG